MSGTMVYDHDNVNGVKLSLKTDIMGGSPNSRLFTISYKNQKNKPWPKHFLLSAIVFNAIAWMYVRISLTSILVIMIVLSFLVFFWITHSVQSESILIIPTVGIQSSVKYVCGREDNWIPWCDIDNVIINEVIKMNRVLYYLTLLIKPGHQSVKDCEEIKLIPLFKYTKPRLVMLQKIYVELQSFLTDVQEEDISKGSGDVG